MVKGQPKYSIISINKNNGSGLRKTLCSVKSQEFLNLEVIIVDAHSTDCTQEVVNEYQGLAPRFLLEETQGIYASMNQGVSSASGEWVIFLNSGDQFFSSRVLTQFQPDAATDIAFGRAWIEESKEPAEYNGLGKIWRGMPFCHQASFTRRERLTEHPFDARLEIVADYKFFVDAYLAGMRFEELDLDVCKIEPPGKSGRQIIRRLYEKYEVASKAFPDKPVAMATLYQLAREYTRKLYFAFRFHLAKSPNSKTN